MSTGGGLAAMRRRVGRALIYRAPRERDRCPACSSTEVDALAVHTLRRAIVMVGDVSRVALQIDVSLPALQRRVQAGDAVQPAWGQFLERIGRYGLPCPPRVRYPRHAGPLATLVVAYRE